MKFKIVCLDNEFPSTSPELDAFKEIKGEWEFVKANCSSEEELIAASKDADATLSQWSYLTPKVIESMEKCKVIVTYGIGVDRIDVETATRKGIYVCNNPDYNKHEVSNHAVALMLALSRQLFQFDRNMRQGKYGWTYLDVELHRLETQTAGLISFGKISAKIAQKCQSAFGMQVLTYDPYIDPAVAKSMGVEVVDLPTIFKKSDYVFVNGPLTKENFHMVNKPMLNLMKPTAYIINTGRGAIVDTESLIEALREKRIAGAGLDVFEGEPIGPGHPLMEFDNVILTPHGAWHTRESLYDMQWGSAKQAVLVLNGEDPTRCVNFDAVKEIKVQRTHT